MNVLRTCSKSQIEMQIKTTLQAKLHIQIANCISSPPFHITFNKTLLPIYSSKALIANKFHFKGKIK